MLLAQYRNHLRALFEIARRAPMSAAERIFVDGFWSLLQEELAAAEKPSTEDTPKEDTP